MLAGCQVFLPFLAVHFAGGQSDKDITESDFACQHIPGCQKLFPEASGIQASDGNPVCWQGGFDYKFCCTPPNGNQVCWDDDFDYKKCCTMSLPSPPPHEQRFATQCWEKFTDQKVWFAKASSVLVRYGSSLQVYQSTGGHLLCSALSGQLLKVQLSLRKSGFKALAVSACIPAACGTSASSAMPLIVEIFGEDLYWSHQRRIHVHAVYPRNVDLSSSPSSLRSLLQLTVGLLLLRAATYAFTAMNRHTIPKHVRMLVVPSSGQRQMSQADGLDVARAVMTVLLVFLNTVCITNWHHVNELVALGGGGMPWWWHSRNYIHWVNLSFACLQSFLLARSQGQASYGMVQRRRAEAFCAHAGSLFRAYFRQAPALCYAMLLRAGLTFGLPYSNFSVTRTWFGRTWWSRSRDAASFWLADGLIWPALFSDGLQLRSVEGIGWRSPIAIFHTLWLLRLLSQSILLAEELFSSLGLPDGVTSVLGLAGVMAWHVGQPKHAAHHFLLPVEIVPPGILVLLLAGKRSQPPRMHVIALSLLLVWLSHLQGGDSSTLAFAMIATPLFWLATRLKLDVLGGWGSAISIVSRLSFWINLLVEVVLFVVNAVLLEDAELPAVAFVVLSHSLGVLLACTLVAYVLDMGVSQPLTILADVLWRWTARRVLTATRRDE